MDTTHKNIGKEIKLAGITCRTCNKGNQSADDLKLLWERFFGEKIMEKLQQRKNDNIISAYHEYESRYEGDYSAFIGFELQESADPSSLPDGMSLLTVPHGPYQVYEVNNPTPEKVMATWRHIWSEDEHLNRRYACDFEVYHDNKGGTPVCVEIFIGINNG